MITDKPSIGDCILIIEYSTNLKSLCDSLRTIRRYYSISEQNNIIDAAREQINNSPHITSQIRFSEHDAEAGKMVQQITKMSEQIIDWVEIVLARCIMLIAQRSDEYSIHNEIAWLEQQIPGASKDKRITNFISGISSCTERDSRIEECDSGRRPGYCS